MSTFTVPEKALYNSNEFKDWCAQVHQELFGCPFIERTIDRKFPIHNEEQARFILNQIISKVSLVLFDDPNIPIVFTKPKKHPTKVSDILAVTAYLIMEQYDVKLIRLSELMGLNHSSLIYYKKKVDAMFFYAKDTFTKKYARILMTLLNTGVLPSIKTPRPEVEKYIRDKQVFMEQFVEEEKKILKALI